MWLVGLVLLGLLWTVPSEAACTANGGNVFTAANATQAEVLLCYNAVAAGGTINVPAGNGGTWSSSITITKAGLKIVGAGIGQTIISANSFILGDIDGVELSGFDIRGMNDLANVPNAFSVRGTRNFNIHHNAFACVSWSTWLFFHANSTRTNYPSGVFHHNQSDRCRWLPKSGYDGASNASSLDGDKGWNDADPWGTNLHAIYIEDNSFTMTDCVYGNSGVLCNTIDAADGAYSVIRFNTFTNTYLECHPNLYTGHRGPRLMEIYGNLFTCTGTNCSAFHRPGLMKCNATWWHNQTSSAWDSLHYDEVTYGDDRGSQTSSYGGPRCDGTAFLDGNTAPTATYRGWPCRDQVGTSTDAFKWDGSNPAPTQGYRPNYNWRNTRANGTEWVVTADNDNWNNVHLIVNRDFFIDNRSFTGTSGVGEGTLAARPATCTHNPSGESRTTGWGPAYWATDQGSWNTSTSNPQGVQANGADGVLYVCTATNTWTVKYTPYTYPHPLQGGTDTTPPAAPTGVTVQ